ncbi:TetR/AcrR family transcriptional regulator [Gymnodinialimonas sp. 2305UL16-5]
MRTTDPRREPVREPTQMRSQQRVDSILDATKTVLAEHGSSNLKVSQIAKVAGISVSSIYQYFPNKSAILAALCDNYLAMFREVVRDAMADKPETISDLISVTSALLDGYYQFVLHEPVWKDVWSGAGSDKNVEAVGDADTLQNTEVIFDGSKHLFLESAQEEAHQKLFLIITWGGKAVDAAIELPQDEGDVLVEHAKAMLMVCWRDELVPLAHPEAVGDLPDVQNGA